MENLERDIDRTLLLLRNKIRECGFTQLQVQEALGWGRSYISQLLTKQKSLRMEQILQILGVLGIDRADFFAELFPTGHEPAGIRRFPEDRYLVEGQGAELSQSIQELRSLARGLANLLVDREVVGLDELRAAVRSADEEAP